MRIKGGFEGGSVVDTKMEEGWRRDGRRDGWTEGGRAGRSEGGRKEVGLFVISIYMCDCGCMFVCMCVCAVCASMRVCKTCMYVCVSERVCVYVCVSVSVSINVSVRVCVCEMGMFDELSLESMIFYLYYV